VRYLNWLHTVIVRRHTMKKLTLSHCDTRNMDPHTARNMGCANVQVLHSHSSPTDFENDDDDDAKSRPHWQTLPSCPPNSAAHTNTGSPRRRRIKRHTYTTVPLLLAL
jgi:hypothetical protein